MGFSQLPQEVETLLGLLSYGAGVERPGVVLGQVGTKEFGGLDDLHRGSTDVKWTVISLCSQSSPLFCQHSETGCWFYTSQLSAAPPLYADTVVSSANLMWFELCIAALLHSCLWSSKEKHLMEVGDFS